MFESENVVPLTSLKTKMPINVREACYDPNSDFGNHGQHFQFWRITY
jgi:hypothetical protein